DNHVVVVHHPPAVHHRALLHQHQLRVGRVGEEHVRLAPLAHGEGLPRPDRDSLDLIARPLFKNRDEHVQQTAVLGAGGGSQNQRRVPVNRPLPHGSREDQSGHQQSDKNQRNPSRHLRGHTRNKAPPPPMIHGSHPRPPHFPHSNRRSCL